ncbi:MAG TPA: hypothetical protein VIY86_06270, partial [Pirellulaceae bacterium]
GVYLVADRDDTAISAGEALNLRARAEYQSRAIAASMFANWGRDLHWKIFRTRPDVGDLLAYQSLCVKQHQPALNLTELAAI